MRELMIILSSVILSTSTLAVEEHKIELNEEVPLCYVDSLGATEIGLSFIRKRLEQESLKECNNKHFSVEEVSVESLGRYNCGTAVIKAIAFCTKLNQYK